MRQHLPALAVAVLVIAATSAVLPSWGVVSGTRWVALTLGGGVALAALLWSSRTLVFDTLDTSILIFFGFALVSLAWTPDRLQGMHEAFRFVPAIALFVAARRWPERAWTWVPGAALVSLVVIFSMDGIWPDWRAGFGNYNKATEAVVVLIILVCAFRTSWVLPAVLITGVWFFLIDSHMELVGFGGVALLFAWRFLRERPGRSAGADVTIAIAGALVLITLVLGDELKTSLMLRLELAATSIAAWLSAPFAGHGLGSFTYVFPFHSAVPITQLQRPMTMIEAAHFEALQIAVELGAVGFALATVAVVIFIRRVKFDPFYASALSALAGMSLVSYPLREPATLMLTALVAARLVPVTTLAVVPRRKLRAAVLLIPLVMVVFAGAMLPGAVLAERQHALAANVRKSDLPEIERARLALVLELAAYRYYPYRNYERVRLFPALVAWIERGGTVSDERIETVWRISNSASPRSPPVMLSRIRYLSLKKEAVR